MTLWAAIAVVVAIIAAVTIFFGWMVLRGLDLADRRDEDA